MAQGLGFTPRFAKSLLEQRITLSSDTRHPFLNRGPDTATSWGSSLRKTSIRTCKFTYTFLGNRICRSRVHPCILDELDRYAPSAPYWNRVSGVLKDNSNPNSQEITPVAILIKHIGESKYKPVVNFIFRHVANLDIHMKR